MSMFSSLTSVLAAAMLFGAGAEHFRKTLKK